MGDLRYRVVKKQITRDIRDLKTGDESTIEDLIAGGGGGDITPEQVKSLYESNANTNAYTDDDKDKLGSVAEGATVNQTNAYLLARANHTGTQAISSVTGLQSALDGKVAVVTGKQLSTEDFTTALKTKLDGVSPAATANQTDSFLLNRTNHSGTQAIGTIVGLTEALNGKAASDDYRLSAGGATLETVRSIGTGATQAAAGNHTHSAATASANGFMTSAMFSKLNVMPTFRLAAEAPASTSSPGQPWDVFVTTEYLYLCIATDTWKQVLLTDWT